MHVRAQDSEKVAGQGKSEIDSGAFFTQKGFFLLLNQLSIKIKYIYKCTIYVLAS